MFRVVSAQRVLLIAMPLLAFIPRSWIAAHMLYGSDQPVFDIGFGFGGYIRELLQSGTFRSCSFLPFQPCHPGICTSSTRMPFLPLLLAGLAAVVGTKSLFVALARCGVAVVLSTGFLAFLTVDVELTWFGVALVYALYFGPQALKHGATLDYEEGLFIDLSLCLAIAICYLLRPDLTQSAWRRAFMALAAVALSVIMYLTKTTALLMLLVVLLLVMTRGVGRPVKLACLLIVALPVGAWLAHNLRSSGVATASSSWNGENLFRGYNNESYELYPQIHLDRIFDSRLAILDDGRSVALGAHKSDRCFNDEWTWNQTYGQMARRWLVDHPGTALAFAARKLWVTLFEVRHTPVYDSATDKRVDGARFLRVLMLVWMVIARLPFFLLLAFVYRDLRAGRNPSYGWAALLLAAGCAPYVLVFSYERHVIPILQMAAVMLAVLYFRKTPGLSRSDRKLPAFHGGAI